jgi:hypothetical protein
MVDEVYKLASYIKDVVVKILFAIFDIVETFDIQVRSPFTIHLCNQPSKQYESFHFVY